MFFKKNKPKTPPAEKAKEKHHPFAPSSLQRRKDCPASYRIEKDLEDVENEYSRKGSYMHERIAAAIKDQKSFVPESDEEHEIVLKILKYLFSNLGVSQFVHTEESLEYKDENGEILYFGTSDLVAMDEGGQLMIFDWKTGHGSVPQAKENLQLKAYALAAMQTYKTESCKVLVYNPVINQRSSWTFKNVEKLKTEILEIIERCKKEDAPAKSGWSQCRFCLGSVHCTCPARIGQDEYEAEAERRRQFRESEKELDRKLDDIARRARRDLYGPEPKKKKISNGWAWFLVIAVILMIIGAIFGQ